MGGGPTGDRLRGWRHLPPCAPQCASPDQDVIGAGPSLSLLLVLWPQEKKKTIVGSREELGEARALRVPSIVRKGLQSGKGHCCLLLTAPLGSPCLLKDYKAIGQHPRMCPGPAQADCVCHRVSQGTQFPVPVRWECLRRWHLLVLTQISLRNLRNNKVFLSI